MGPLDRSKSEARLGGGIIVQEATRTEFWRVWQRHKAHLERQSLRHMSRNVADAEDALSTAMIRAFERFSLHTGESLQERSWLSRVLHNVCMDLHRRRRGTRSAEELSDEGAPEWVSEEEQRPDKVLLEFERVARIQERIQTLPPRLRTAFEMRFQQGLAYTDIAGQLQLTHCNVRKRIQLASGLLRAALSE
jgi:RNA polymerase sigma factor (sigma-70 family)